MEENILTNMEVKRKDGSKSIFSRVSGKQLRIRKRLIRLENILESILRLRKHILQIQYNYLFFYQVPKVHLY